ncbi:MAG TPA: type II secretion system F family protein [Dongiaceae bacterium]|nr:type II secretion system F family protein [Dongiaceae bacterium]
MNQLAARLPDIATLDMALLAGGAVLAVVLLIVFALLGSGRDKLRARRLARVAQRPQATSDKTKLRVKRSTANSSIVAIDRIIKHLLPNAAKLRVRLARTGHRISVGQYLVACLLVGAAPAVGLKLAVGLPVLAALMVGLILGVGLPHLVVGFLGKRRLKRFNDLFPDAIDLIVRGLKSGLPVTESIKIVGTEIGKPVGEEFRLIGDSIKFGMNLNEALTAAAARIDTPEFRFFNITLSIQQETGGNLAETLENLGNVIRRRRQMRLKIKAYSSEAKASAYIIGSLPFIMFGIILTMNYDYLMTLFRDPRGLMMFTGGVLSFMIGVATMAKMVRFEI